jgi:5-methylcytosine-specific restriction endonuclease McrA
MKNIWRITMKRKICNYPGCTALIAVTERYCEEHKRENSKPFQNAVRTNAALYNTARWKKLRSKIVREHPHCSRCGISKNESRLEVHHLVEPRGNEELFFDENNLVPVCDSCHRNLTAQEIYNRRNKHDA